MNCSNSPKISVIIPNYNQSKYIKDAIESVLNQTYKNIELIIVDDASTDESLNIIKPFLIYEKVKLIKCKKNSGRESVPRNIGIRNSTGEFIAFLDADDVWLQRKLEKQIEFYDIESHIAVGCSYISIGSIRYKKKICHCPSQTLGLRDILFGKSVAPSSLLLRNNRYFFNESPEYRMVSDFEFVLRLIVMSNKSIGVIREPLLLYRIHSFSGSSCAETMKNSLNVLKKYIQHVPKKDFNKIYANKTFHIGLRALRKNSCVAIEYFKVSLKNYNIANKPKALLGIALAKFPYKIRFFLLRCIFNLINLKSLVSH